MTGFGTRAARADFALRAEDRRLFDLDPQRRPPRHPILAKRDGASASAAGVDRRGVDLDPRHGAALARLRAGAEQAGLNAPDAQDRDGGLVHTPRAGGKLPATGQRPGAVLGDPQFCRDQRQLLSVDPAVDLCALARSHPRGVPVFGQASQGGDSRGASRRVRGPIARLPLRRQGTGPSAWPPAGSTAAQPRLRAWSRGRLLRDATRRTTGRSRASRAMPAGSKPLRTKCWLRTRSPA